MKEQEELLANAEELCSSGKPKELLRARELCEKALTKDPYSEKGMMILKDVYEKLYKTGQLKTERQKEEDLKNQMLHNDLTPDSLKRFPYY